MYISEISGHHSATLAIEKSLNILSPGSEILNINAFNYTNPISEKIVNRMYMTIIKRAPQIWNYLYDNPAIAKNLAKIKETIHKFNSPKLKNLFEKFKPDAVLCSQAFPCGMVADYKKEFKSDIPLVAVLTDYVPHSYWLYDNVNYYITPSEDVAEKLQQKGVEGAKIKPFGIPFDPDFNRPVLRSATAAKFGLDPEVFTILVMGGGQGLGPIKTIVKSLDKITKPIQQVIVTGSNKKLFKSLENKIGKYKNKAVLFGYASNVNELMSISDVIITKPGGITTAEALAKCMPMIIVKPLPGQELNNTAFLTQKKAAIKLDKASDINSIIEDLLNKPDKLKGLSDAAKAISKPNASMDTAKLLLGLCNHRDV